jgi:quercetin dioxygenase-like cupin family protein
MPGPKSQPVTGPDPVIVDSRHYKLEFENEQMRVLRVSYGAREKSVRHSHPDFVALSLTDVHVRFTLPDGKTEDRQWKAGDVYWGSAGQCLPENLTDRRNELILFEMKPKGTASHAAIKDDPVKVDAKHYKPEFENERVRVLRATYGPHEKSAMHDHPALAVAFLTDHHVKFAYADGRTEEISEKAGKVRWFPAVRHLPENLADEPLRVVLVEVKN